MTDRVRLVAIGGLACACAQSLLDRSGIVPFGGGASSFPQQVTWAVLALVSALTLFYLYRERRPRAVVVLGVAASVFALVGSVMIVSMSWTLGQGSQLLVDILTLVLICARAVAFQLGVYCILADSRPVRFLVSVGVLCFALTLLVASLGSDGGHLVGYLAVTLGAPLLTLYAVVQHVVKEREPSRMPASEHRLFGPHALGKKRFARFCAVQLLPTMLTGSICVIEMYVPFAVLPYQQFASLVSGLLLIALFAGLSTFGETRLPDQFIVVVPVLLVLFVAMPLGASETFSSKPFFILMTHFGAAVGYLNAYLTMRKHHTEPSTTAFWGQMLLFFGMVAGSALTAFVLVQTRIASIPDGVYLGLTLGALLVLLVAFLAMIVFSQQKAALPVSEHAANRHEDLSVSGRGGRVDSVAKRYGLTAREKDVLALLDSGYSRQRIAEELGVSESTVKTHLNNLYAKLGVHKRDEALDLTRSL